MTDPTGALADQLKQLSLEDAEKQFPSFYPAYNAQDLYRQHISTLLAEASGVDPKIIYPAIQWTTSLDKGDFNVAVPALRVKGKKPDELGAEWAAKVHILSWPSIGAVANKTRRSSQSRHSSRNPRPSAPFCDSTSSLPP